jgi:hypothetical protein
MPADTLRLEFQQPSSRRGMPTRLVTAAIIRHSTDMFILLHAVHKRETIGSQCRTSALLKEGHYLHKLTQGYLAGCNSSFSRGLYSTESHFCMAFRACSSPGKVKNFLISTSSRPVLRPTQPPIQWVPCGNTQTF